MYKHQLSPDLSFESASTLYLAMRTIDAMPGAITARYIRKTTETNYRQYVRTLGLFFNGMRMEDIHLGNIRAYQIARVRGDEPFVRRRRPHEEPSSVTTKPQAVNQEVCFLRSVMRMAQCWGPDHEQFYEELQEEESEIPRALEAHEQQKWIDVARMKERWEIIHWYSIVAFESTMSTNEQRGLRLGDVNLHHQTISIPWPAAKNKHRHRSIAIEGADALWALDRLIGRAHDLGAHDPRHYLYPFRNGRTNQYEPDKHMTNSGIKKLWQEVREASGLTWFRPYDTRHTGITRMAEMGIPIEVIKAKAGHVSDKMSQHYTHISLNVQRKWMKSYANQQPPPPQYLPHGERRHFPPPPMRYGHS